MKIERRGWFACWAVSSGRIRILTIVFIVLSPELRNVPGPLQGLHAYVLSE